jgi:hypothetical protein
MIKVLKELLGRVLHERAAKSPAPVARPRRRNPGGDFRAVSVAPCIVCCKAALRAADRAYLLHEAPRLPLQDCTMPAKCSCKFRKNADRRDSDRRLFGARESTQWFAGLESRRRAIRRSTDR